MQLIISALKGLPLPLLVTGGSLILLAAAFVFWFLVPAVRLRVVLSAVLRELLNKKKADQPELLQIFSRDEKLKHLWCEFAETLHRQTEFREGMTITAATRSTQPAETYFNSQFVVDGRIRSEFFKHVPGIFTGIGIIGTFSGLIGGLREFQTGLNVPPDAAQGAATNRALASLLQEVSTAFFVSAIAITFAMLTTFVEKILLTSLYGLTEEIAQNIDERFDAGAGEEYLARLVDASEDSATQAKILKDSLVNDLKDVLREIAEKQISASTAGSVELGTRIAQSITEGLSNPLAEISSSVKAASGDQSVNATRLLQDAMASFSQQVSDLFGGQMKGIAALNNGAAENMSGVVQSLNRLVGTMEGAAQRSSETMTAQIADAIQRMEQHQSATNGQSAAFVEQLRALVAASQSETSEAMQQALTAMSQSVDAMIASMAANAEGAMHRNSEREQQLATRTGAAVAEMSGSVDAAVQQMVEASRVMQNAVADISRVVASSMDRMMMGAETLNGASVSFAEAGIKVSGVMNQASIVSGKLAEISGALNASSDALQTTIGDYRAQRDAIMRLTRELASVVDGAKREASVTSDVLSRIEDSAQKLAFAQSQTSDYLDGIGSVLIEAQEKFTDATLRTLDRVNTEFHQKLTTSVQLLSSSIGELEATLATVGSKP